MCVRVHSLRIELSSLSELEGRKLWEDLMKEEEIGVRRVFEAATYCVQISRTRSGGSKRE